MLGREVRDTLEPNRSKENDWTICNVEVDAPLCESLEQAQMN